MTDAGLMGKASKIGPYRHRCEYAIHRVDAVRSYDGRNTASLRR
jgi:hypothetical protein